MSVGKFHWKSIWIYASFEYSTWFQQKVAERICWKVFLKIPLVWKLWSKLISSCINSIKGCCLTRSFNDTTFLFRNSQYTASRSFLKLLIVQRQVYCSHKLFDTAAHFLRNVWIQKTLNSSFLRTIYCNPITHFFSSGKAGFIKYLSWTVILQD